MSRKNYRILIVDDERSFVLLLKRIVEDEGYTVMTAYGGSEALAVAQTFRPHLIITDLRMPDMDGITLIESYKQCDIYSDYIVLTAFGTVDTAVKSMKMGACDYIVKPLKEPEELRIAIRKVYERKQLIDENWALKTELDKDLPPFELIFAGMDELKKEIVAVAPTDATIMLTGETGTGKSLIAKVIHNISKRKGPFVEVNCASVPEHLLESEFFGHEKGAFTGAISPKKGKFEIASEGTIFLDEISEMYFAMQSKLLRVLQDGSFERLGSNMTKITNARVISATNRDLKSEVAQSRFRQDLFFRLNVFPLQLKPLRERKIYIPLIANYLVKTISQKMKKQIREISEQTMNRIVSYTWPGNIRELHNVLERAIILAQGEVLDIIKVNPDREEPESCFIGSLKKIEKKAIQDTLQHTGGKRKRAAEILGISLRALQYKIKDYRILL